MELEKNTLQAVLVGSSDFIRRIAAALRLQKVYGRNTQVSLNTASYGEAKSLVIAERPDVLIVDVGIKTTFRDIIWLRGFLKQVRERLKREVYIVLAITSPTKFVLGGSLLFASEDSLEPSGLIDNIVIPPPPRIPGILSLEEQVCDCLGYVAELHESNDKNLSSLPALYDNDWVPVMCDPISRNIWMRWLPRYARYVNENPLIVGPTGSGKTRLAAALHNLSGRTGPFVSITPRDFSSTELVQAELFGAVAGAYTGAVEKWGLVKRSEKGTLFIDELQSIDLDLQGKLITFIENKSYRRVGEAESHQADVRFVFATNLPLQRLVDDGSLRADFAYRLERLHIELPALKERRLDIAAALCLSLAKVLRERVKALGLTTKSASASSFNAIEGLTPEAYAVVFSSSWPGNLRQLENTVAKLIEYADIRKLTLIDKDCALETLKGLLGYMEISSVDIYEKASLVAAAQAREIPFSGIDDYVLRLEDNARIEALQNCGGDTNQAAKLLHDSAQAMSIFAATRTARNTTDK